MKQLQAVKGMHDILPEEMVRWRNIEEQFRNVLTRYGYSEIRTPIVEPLELFVRGIGDTTDIVEKEMYTFEDKGGDHLALRPEGTASAIRAYIQHGFHGRSTECKWFYIGPMFRRERPAKGRYRQFYQAGAELVGVSSPLADAEMIDMTARFIESLGISSVVVQLNTLGGGSTRPKYRDALKNFFSSHTDALCGDCQRRLERNPLRILDCKVECCREVSREAPKVLDYLSDEDDQHFQEVRRVLDSLRTAYAVDPSMVRGLDYYTRTIFEIKADTENLGAQTSVLGGGRYDNLVEQLGGRATPAVGFSFGIERLIMALRDQLIPTGPLRVFVAGVGDSAETRTVGFARELRGKGIIVEYSYELGSLKSQLRKADRFGADFTVIAGADEAARGTVTVRNMKNGEQKEIAADGLADFFEAIK